MLSDPTPEMPLPAPPVATLLATALTVAVAAIELASADGDDEVGEAPGAALTLTVTPTLPQSCWVKASTSRTTHKEGISRWLRKERMEGFNKGRSEGKKRNEVLCRSSGEHCF